MSVATLMTRSMVMENSHGNREMSTRVTISMMREMATEKCTLLMVPFTRVNGQEAFRMEEEL